MKKNKLFASVLALLLAFLMLVSLVLCALPVHAAELTSDKLEELENQISSKKEELGALEGRQEEIENELKKLDQNKKDNWSNIEIISQERLLVDEQIGLLNMEILTYESQIQSYNQLIAAKQQEVDVAQGNLEQLNQEYKDRIRAMEEHGTISFWSVLFKANSFMDLLDRLHMIQEIAQADKRRLAELEQAAQVVEQARDALEETKSQMEVIKLGLEDSKVELEEKQAQSQVLMDRLLEENAALSLMVAEFEAQEEELLKEILSKKDELDELDQAAEEELERLKEEERKKQEAANKPSGGGTSGPVSSAFWQVPCNYILLTSPWGYRWHPISGNYTMHYGVDLAGITGTPIVATRAGVVTVADYDRYGYGYYVEIDHRDGFSSLYAHMTHFIVSVGQVVAQGQVIGYMGSTGGSTGPHLHFGVYYNNVSVNPMEYIG